MPPEPLPARFETRDQLVQHVASLATWLVPRAPSPIVGDPEVVERGLEQFDPEAYGRNRNHLDGAVTRLSPFVRHGTLTLDRLRNEALERTGNPERFVQQLAWRDFWLRIYWRDPEWIWEDVEPYKTGFTADDYADELPEDLAGAASGVACVDHFVRELLDTGYLHNHARMYVAAYTVHWRRVKWQVGARWFLHHLLDGDPCSNNLSWQWVASTFANKPYIFNLENVRKYAHDAIDTTAARNAVLDASYEELDRRLFPHREASDG